jgi:GNAT superfamily N-acetyltransferase
VGTKLYQFLQAQLASLNPSLIQSCVREDQSDGIRFLKSQGFHEAMSTWEAVLDISNADIPKTQEDETRLKARGIEIKTIVELGSDPDWDSKLFDLFSILISDIPMMMKRPRLTREYFERCILGNEAMLPEAFFVAVAGGIYVGMTNLFREPQPDALGTRQTGVLREFRRQGIASALKKRGLRFAREHGYRVVKTHNASDNLPIVKLNERLDFAKRLSWITYRREV